MRLVPGSRLDSYEIIAPLGEGGMGEMYRARDTSLKRDVAIKVLPDRWSRDPGRLHRFELEAQATAGLNNWLILELQPAHVDLRGGNAVDQDAPDGSPKVLSSRFLVF